MATIRMMLLLATLTVPAAAAAQIRLESQTVPVLPASPDDPKHDVALTQKGENRMTVNVQVAGKGPYRFVVDTGSERTVISRELAEKLALEAGQRVNLQSVVGVAGVNTVMIPSLEFARNDLAIVDAPALEARNIGADGMLGVDTLRSKRVLLDFKAGTMSITPDDEPAAKLEGETIVVRAKTRKGRLIFTDATIADEKVTIILDTGSEVTVGNSALRRLLQREWMWTLPTPVTIQAVTGQSLQAKLTRVEKLKMGGIDLGNLSIAFVDAHLFKQLDLENRPALLLGMNAMQAFDRVQIDFAAKKVRFVLPGTSMIDGYRLAMGN